MPYSNRLILLFNREGKMKPELETAQPDLFSSLRRNLNSLKENQTPLRRQALDELHRIVTAHSLPSHHFDELAHLALKELLRSFADSSEYNRERSVATVLQLVSRCSSVRGFLPYIFAVLTDRTNCVDLEGVAQVPEKMRPAPGQKPKMVLKLVQQCEQIRLLFCQLMRRLLALVEENDIRDKLDEIVNILRALIMDPAPEVQRSACEVLDFFCSTFKMLLLHYTEIMGRALLLPLVSKKSKIRIAALKALTAVLWCGLWKYNAFVFENLVGFRDPNSVAIKDFYQPSNNINYLATFVNDPNVRVRQEFMRQVHSWTCSLDDKYDHHGRLVPYMLSGLSDPDPEIRQTALQMIQDIGQQIEIEKEKELRDSKQYAIDAAWTWDGALAQLPTEEPLVGRPSLGSRVFIRGHVRKFWTAIYKQIKDIHLQNRLRAAQLMVYGVIFTENYMAQYLDVMLPHLFSSAIASSPEDQPIARLVCRTLHLLGRYCEVSAYQHIVASALKGELVQNEDFLRSALKGVTELVEGAFEDIPLGTGLARKRQQVEALLSLIEDCGICPEIYRGNSLEGLELCSAFLRGLKAKGSPQENQELLGVYLGPLLRLLGVSYYEMFFGQLLASGCARAVSWQRMREQFGLLREVRGEWLQGVEQLLQQAFLSPPSLMDSDWKTIIFLHGLLSHSQDQQEEAIFRLAQETVCCCLQANRSVEMVRFVFQYVPELLRRQDNTNNLSGLHQLLAAAATNLLRFQPVKQVPVYDQALLPPVDPSLQALSESVFVPLFAALSQALQAFFDGKAKLAASHLAKVLHLYLRAFARFSRDKRMVAESVRTVWLILQRAELKETDLPALCLPGEEEGPVVVVQELIDFLVLRLESMGEPNPSQVAMVFSGLCRLARACPKIEHAATKLSQFYPGYPSLLEKLFKYALDEKDLETRGKYGELLRVLCGRLRPWFELELRVSEEGSRFARAALLRSILESSGK